MSIIYIITGPSKSYIGQHKTKYVEKRIKSHVAGYEAYSANKTELKRLKKEDPNGNYEELEKLTKKGCIALYRAFEKHGIENFEYEVLHSDIDPKDIDDLEDKCILEYNTLVPNGYNLRLNQGRGQMKTLSEESRKRFSEAAVLKNKKYLDKYRRYKVEMEGLPQYISYYNDKNGYRGYKVMGHPLCKSKSFTSKTIELDILKSNCLKFLESLGNEKYQKEERKLPIGICKPHTNKSQNGYVAYFKFNKQKYRKYFNDCSDDEDNLQEAIDWLKIEKSNIISK